MPPETLTCANLRIHNALAKLLDEKAQDRFRLQRIGYHLSQGIKINLVIQHCGVPLVTPIVLLPNRRFDTPNPDDDTVEGVVIEVWEGDTVVDLVAWPVAAPGDVRTLCGVAAMVGSDQAFDPLTYAIGHPLVVHRTPLEWLKAGCQGAAVVVPRLAAEIFVEIRRPLGASDTEHALELKGLLQELIDPVRIVVPNMSRRVA